MDIYIKRPDPNANLGVDPKKLALGNIKISSLHDAQKNMSPRLKNNGSKGTFHYSNFL
jgi:hypothetical protein